MTLKLVYRDSAYWFSVYRSEETGTHVLVAVRRGNSYESIAMKLTADEVNFLSEAPEDLVMLARNFVHAEDWPAVKPRKIAFREVGPDSLQIDE
ncbi:hypothetical protein BGE01nite_40630 [Brevifollis gellanilyticus]|uniref:Uncharacterized protein n=2 Tax=Brevifollis gellanilyticus TaxID=748831 RepID=A0A512MDJ6_9BACT|nr:hypothetical protein BGE01nite_40630 [Brevifollis gellanilyticus]